MKIGNKEIGEQFPTYIIAEISINHMGNIDTAKKLIDVAAEAKVSAVKLQKRHLPSLYSKEILDNPNSFEQGFQYIIPILKETELSEVEHIELKAYAESYGLEYLCTPFDLESAEFLYNIGVNAFKIASCDLTNADLLRFIAGTKKPMILSTGMSSWKEIETTVEYLKFKECEFALLHCRSAYPVWPREAKMKMITRLRQFGVSVGYSSHDEGTTLSIVAASMGCSIIEKHLTLDKTAKGPDHKVSLLPNELKILVRDIRTVDEAMQDNDRFLLRAEIMNREIFRYKGVDEKAISEQLLKEPFGKWGMIARMTDLQEVMKFNPKVVELRLTENDFEHEFIPKKYDSELLIHAPEYLQNKLLDLCSGNEEIRTESIKMIQKAINRAMFMKDYFYGNTKVIAHIGAMSINTELRVPLLRERLYRSLAQIDDKGVQLLLENLPPYPVYYGGTWKTNYFMGPEEIKEICNETGYNLCYDLSHSAMYCNSADKDLSEFIKIVKPLIKHNHISDSYGLNGEGIQLGDGDIDLKSILPLLDLENISYVPEVWLQHKNNQQGAIEALKKIKKILENSSNI